MSQQNSGNLRRQFRIGSCNFSLQSCQWRTINFRQKSSQNDFLSQKSLSLRIPNARLYHTSVILSEHIYMFGGVSDGIRGEVKYLVQQKNFCAINLKNNKWHQLRLESNPCIRDSCGLSILQKQIYMFGGSNKQRYFNDLYTFNNFTNEWKLTQNKGSIIPLPRDQMMFLSVKNQFLLLIGGINLQSQVKYYQDSYIWKNSQWKQLKSNYPNNLILSKAVQINGRVFVFGGANKVTGEYKSTLYEIVIDQQTLTLNFNQFPLTIQISPEGRINHQMIPINNQYFLLIGGQQLNKKGFKDIWIFDLFLRKWTRIQPSNGPLKEIHSFSAVMYNNIVYLIGGYLENRKQINDLVFMIQFANQQIFKSEICQNCVNIVQKKQQDNKKFPKNLVISVGFLYNMALQIKFPFHAISMIYQASKHLMATQFRIALQKTLNNFNYLKIQFDGCSLGRDEFLSFISHNFVSSQFKKFTQNIKLGAFRLGKTFLFVTSDKKYRYVYLLSAQSRVSPHFDEAYIYYSYIENMQLQRIQTQEGIKQRQLIQNILKTHIACPDVILASIQKTMILIFQTKVVMSSERQYFCELQQKNEDIKVWKNEKKVQFLQSRGYKIQSDLEISLKQWMTFYHIEFSLIKSPAFYINQNYENVKFLHYSKDILLKIRPQCFVIKVQLPTDIDVKITGQIFITQNVQFLEHNYGLLIYSQGKLYSRYDIDFGRLFPQHFYKSKYKTAKTIFYQMGYINIVDSRMEENFFKNGFTRPDKYAALLQRIKQKCDQKRQQILTSQRINSKNINQDEESQGAKKVKV